MANLFNVAEVVDMGIEKEKRRRDFYGLVAEKFQEKDIRGIFSKLRDWEEEHIKKFTEIRSNLLVEETKERYPGELIGYIKALVDDKLYKELTPEDFSVEISAPISAIEIGMEFEKDAVLFFNELLQYVGEGKRDAIKTLIEEEKQHLLYLFQLKSNYK